MIVELAVEDFLRRLHDGLGAARVEEAERAIGSAAARLTSASAAIKGRGMRRSPMAKLCRERSVCAPQ
jgi:hypothetical protein